jgi:hypothetical protein
MLFQVSYMRHSHPGPLPLPSLPLPRPACLLRALPACVRAYQIEWLKSIGITDVASLLYKHPRILSYSPATLASKHHFLTDGDQWGLNIEEIEGFPQALTYSLTYLRSRVGFLKMSPGGKGGKPHRVLRTADYLFALKLCGRTVEEYQAFARAVAVLEGAAAPGDAPRTIAELAEEADSLARGMPQPEVSAGDKHYTQSLKQVAADEVLQGRIDAARAQVDAALSGRGGTPGAGGMGGGEGAAAAADGASTAEAEIAEIAEEADAWAVAPADAGAEGGAADDEKKRGDAEGGAA